MKLRIVATVMAAAAAAACTAEPSATPQDAPTTGATETGPAWKPTGELGVMAAMRAPSHGGLG